METPDYYLGYEDAREMVLLVIDEMANNDNYDFSLETLDELRNRIV